MKTVGRARHNAALPLLLTASILCLPAFAADNAARNTQILFAGTVESAAGEPIADARVAIAEATLTARTDAEGAFRLEGETASAVQRNVAPDQAVAPSVRWRRSGLHITGASGSLACEIYTIQGILLHHATSRTNRLSVDLRRIVSASGVFLVRIKSGGQATVYKAVQPRVSAIAIAGASSGAIIPLGKSLVEQYELIVSAQGYMTERFGPFENGLQDLTLILDSTSLPARVSVEENQETRRVITCGEDDWCKDNEQTEIQSFTAIELDNGLIHAKIFPHLGMRLLDVTDKTREVDYFNVREPLTAHYGSRWKTGGIDVSFPYPEHGMHFYQKSGYRIIEEQDGSALVAMNMRFYQYQQSRERERYGRYDDRILSVMYRMRPYSTAIEGMYRIDNPNPLRRGDRLWITVQLPAYDPSSMHAIFPARGTVIHNGNDYRTTSDPIGDSNLSDSYKGQAFTVECDWPFGGVYYGADKVGRLRITEPNRARGMKFVSGSRLTQDPPYMEFWTGNGTWFEDPGAFVGAFEPVEFKHFFWNTYDIGMPDYADSLFAVALENNAFELVAPRRGHFRVTDFGGTTLAAGIAGPYTKLTGSTSDKNLVIFLDDREIFRASFPLPIADHQDRVAEYKARQNGGAEANERSVVPYHPGPPQLKSCDSPNNCYRLGRFDDLSGDYLLALAAWEQGEAIFWGDSPPEASFFKAAQYIAAGKTSQAIAALESLLDQRPNAYWAKLFHAYITQDMQQARELANQNPALPEAQLVLELLGDPDAAARRANLERDGGAASGMVELFRRLLTQGQWDHTTRFGPLCGGQCP